jgi:hypothetical protein
MEAFYRKDFALLHTEGRKGLNRRFLKEYPSLASNNRLA